MNFSERHFSPIYTLEQVQELLVELTPNCQSNATRTRVPLATVGSILQSTCGSALAKAQRSDCDQKLRYYKRTAQRLPSDIGEHSDEITRMMEKGMPAEEAFAEAVNFVLITK